ncbi:hypothetical protein PTSG_01825 [Salpingoeca rosetta]|uniref:Sugar phosphate phosphatase n=1 Tax=Salpingoeca rosetta (strain ATCC 50818 / BSB-021) TaxID=946362 RepID=F2TZ24_SALR5|nr:uncharacterized protein PTSG_01825 [Salpingoeca rosetta]EGD78848.1 hypothetical protein PTSG_01825 [Salpingoeca rosetta]|eukprot:XP_004997804.1 hypothetical protein PTSG_01825 [Salpingoeca rosetta]
MTESTLPPQLDFSKPGSFPYETLRTRMPVILTKAIDSLHQHISDNVEDEGRSEAMASIGRLTKLKYEMQTGKVMRKLDDDGDDVDVWHETLDRMAAQHSEDAKWWKLPWLFSECYMYRRIREATLLSRMLRDVDPFWGSKTSSYHCSETRIGELAAFVHGTACRMDNNEKAFEILLQFSLWGNKSDLSLMADFDGSESLDHMQASTEAHLQELKQHILCDDTAMLWERVSSFKNACVHIVLDNAGIELFSDLCFAHWLVHTNHAKTVVFHGKAYPWFVSDVTRRDLDWMLDQLSETEDSDARAHLAALWKQHFAEGVFVYQSDPFWTYPHEFERMPESAPDLYKTLASADLIMFKGDLNYRKLVADRMWPADTPFEKALGPFTPAMLVALRTLKSDTLAGVPLARVKQAEENDPAWNVNGTTAVIQCFRPAAAQ